MPDANTIELYYDNQLFDVRTDQLGSGTICPLINVDVSCDKDKNGTILSFTNNIVLNGIILANNISGTTAAYSGVVNFFSNKKYQNKVFEIKCNSMPLLQFSGTVFDSASASTSENNWVITLPYTVNLTSVVGASGEPPIESYDDSWTIEPIQEISYFNIQEKSDYYGYKNINTPTNKPPSSNDLAVKNEPEFKIQNLIQYRITHRLSAVGKISTQLDSSVNPSPGAGINTTNRTIQAYQHAAEWVNRRANSIGKTSSTPSNNSSGLIIYDFPVKNSSTVGSGLTLYNHMRTIETSVSEGSYSLTDTWLALGSGTRYTEDFSWEISVDDKYLRTVSMNGTITGLEDVGASGYTYFPTVSLTGDITGASVLPISFPAQTRQNNKFNNALNAYTSGIKPQLYRRASTALFLSNKSGIDGVPRGGLLNINPLSYTETMNPIAGTIGYSISYSNKPGSWLSGALNSTLTIQDTMPADQVAESFVLGRPLGPVLQKVGATKTERQLTLEVVYPTPTGYKEAHPQSSECIINSGRPEFIELKSLVDSFRPINPVAFATLVPTSPYPIADNGVVFKTNDSRTWNPFEGRLSWQVTWVYTTGNCSMF